MALEVCTDVVPLPDRPDYWRQISRTLFKDDCLIKPDPQTSFAASTSLMKIGPLLLSDCRGSSFRMIRKGCDEAGGLALLIQKDGECVIRRPDRETRLSPGCFCVFPADSELELDMRSEFRQLALRFPAILLSERYPDWERHTFSPIPGDSGAGGIFLGLVHAMLQHGEAALNQCCLDAFQAMLVILGSALRENSAPLPAVPVSRMGSYHKARIRDFVFDNLANPELDVSMVAEAIQLSPRYIHRLFADEPLQLMQWILSERLARCLDELASQDNTGRRISAIAYAWGFNDTSHFSRSFRKRYGVSPREIQRMSDRSGLH